MTIFQEEDAPFDMSIALRDLGSLYALKGDYRTAIAYCHQGIAVCDESGNLNTLQDAPLTLMGTIAYSLGDDQQARSYLYPILESHLKAASLEAYGTVADAMNGMATVLAQEGKPAQGIELLTHVLHHRMAGHDRKHRAAKLLAKLAPEAAEQTSTPTRSLETVVAELLCDMSTAV